MKWRLQEGQGEAIYKIGVEDGGVCAGLSDNELKSTMNTLEEMAKRYECMIVVHGIVARRILLFIGISFWESIVDCACMTHIILLTHVTFYRTTLR